MELVNLSNGVIIAKDVKVAKTFWKRFKGLMFTKDLQKGSALLIEPCQSVHTFFMSYALDILFVNEEGKVVAVEEQMKPGKIGKIVRTAKQVIELPAGTIRATKIEVNQVIKLKN
ncbi:DUF192 domain-containing protein [Calidifontibacillus oryziterrae]|uniref:DUF192 domain-containing protein n=1 Tax=Calidifontibacillus oryziterrae TaxID=1191699 RepID=UPI0002F80F58|nr:DUF192 domain-containing protein [Calidifontibacillus oryziterrae]